MTVHAVTTILNPANPAVRAGAKRLADRLSGDTPVEAAVRAMLNDLAHGKRVVVLRAEEKSHLLRPPRSSPSPASSSIGSVRTAYSPSVAYPAVATAGSASKMLSTSPPNANCSAPGPTPSATHSGVTGWWVCSAFLSTPASCSRSRS